MSQKIIRTIGLFAATPGQQEIDRLKELKTKAEAAGFEVQTLRLITKDLGFKEFESRITDEAIILGLGTVTDLSELVNTKRVFCNLASTDPKPLFDIIKNKPEKTFNFTYVFNNVNSTPYFPSSNYEQDGFSVGLQPTDLSENCQSLEEFFGELISIYQELLTIFSSEPNFLGIDSSIAPLYQGKSSLVNFVRKLRGDFKSAVTTDIFVKITNFIKQNNPRPVGLCGLMLPALEDFELAEEYEKGEFSIERNIFLSLHSGLGIDTYPIGIDEKPERVGEILRLLDALAKKYNKPLSARFVSDGKAKIGDKTDFKNQYLRDVVVRPL